MKFFRPIYSPGTPCSRRRSCHSTPSIQTLWMKWKPQTYWKHEPGTSRRREMNKTKRKFASSLTSTNNHHRHHHQQTKQQRVRGELGPNIAPPSSYFLFYFIKSQVSIATLPYHYHHRPLSHSTRWTYFSPSDILVHGTSEVNLTGLFSSPFLPQHHCCWGRPSSSYSGLPSRAPIPNSH